MCLWFFICCQSVVANEREISVAAIFRDEAPYLKEWIDYHRSVGVEYFWLYDDISKDNFREVLQPYIEEGVVEVIDWSVARERIKTWPSIQVEAYRHAIKEAVGKTKWLALIDTDEFILPMTDTSIQSCLANHYPQAQAVYMQWRMFGTSGVWLSDNESMLDQLTYCSEKNHPWNRVGKSIVQPASILIDRIWYNHHFPLADSDCYADGSGKKIPMVHDDLYGPEHSDKYIRINHYFFRDEKYYRETKIPRKLERNLSIDELTDLHTVCNKKRDFTITNFLKKSNL